MLLLGFSCIYVIDYSGPKWKVLGKVRSNPRCFCRKNLLFGGGKIDWKVIRSESLASMRFAEPNNCKGKLMIRRLLRRFAADESGPTAVEYAVMLALIIAVCITAVRGMATAVRSSFDSSANAINNAIK